MVAVAAAPAIAAGPPGWVVFALALAGSAALGALAGRHASSRSRSTSIPRTRDVTIEDCPPRRPWSVRVHAQGTDIDGTSGSTIGAPPVTQTSGPVCVAQGVALAGATFAMLEARPQRNLEPAFDRCVRFIEARPPAGFLGKRSFYGRSNDNNRFDVDSFGPSNNFVS